MLQRLWKHNLTWDEPVPDQIEHVRKRWHDESQGLRRDQEAHLQEQWKEHVVTATPARSHLKSHESMIELLTQDVDTEFRNIAHLKKEPMAPTRWPIA